MTGDLKLVKQGYADLFEKDDAKAYANRSLQFTVTFQDVPQLCKAIRLVKEYNEFNGDGVAVTVNMFAEQILWGEFGRSYSPVLYLTLKSDADVQQIIGAFKAQDADEVDFSNGRLRVWWD